MKVEISTATQPTYDVSFRDRTLAQLQTLEHALHDAREAYDLWDVVDDFFSDNDLPRPRRGE